MSKSSLLVAFCCTLTCGMFSGCKTDTGFQAGLLGYPIPVSPYFQDELEDRWWDKERYDRVPILGPITGEPPAAIDPPSDDEVMRAMESVEGGIPYLWERQRNNVRITKELIADYVDPPRFYPLIGWAQQHHAHYKCTIYYQEATRVGWPIPYTTIDEDSQEVIYIDHNHFHMVGNVDGGPGSNYQGTPHQH